MINTMGALTRRVDVNSESPSKLKILT